MLNQIRILYPHQVITMWVNGRTLVRLRVRKLFASSNFLFTEINLFISSIGEKLIHCIFFFFF